METARNQENDIPCLDLNDLVKPYEEISAPSSSKRRKLVSEVWKDFHKVRENEVDLAICNHCNKKLVGSSKSGTTHLKNHLGKCPAKKNRDANLEVMPHVKANFVFDQERSSLDVARMIIKHGYTLNMAEHEFFKIFVNNLQPMFKLPSEDIIRANVLHVYKEEKEKLCIYFNKLSCQFSLIINFRTCHLKRIVYCCVTLQFIHGLELKKKILALKNVEYNCDSETHFGNLRSLLLEWNIHKKVCSITNESSSSDKMVRKLKGWLSAQGSLPISKHIFHINCCMQVLKILVWDGLNEISSVLNKITEAIKYVDETPLKKEKFQDAVNQEKLLGKMSSRDVNIGLDSTFVMLEIAVAELTEVLSLLQQIDSDSKLRPYEGWCIGIAVSQCLKVFYDVVGSLLGRKNLTANVYFPKVCDIHKILLQLHNSEHTYIQVMGERMKKKFDKYWDECSLALAIAVVFDPRFKFCFVEYSYKELYGEDAMIYLRDIHTALDNLYDAYENDLSSSTLISPAIIDSSYCTMVDSFGRSYNSDRGANSVVLKREELNRYLEEPNFSIYVEIDILGWWHSNTSNFPTLSRMARDILAIPMSSVVSNPILSPTMDGLDSKITEALICGEDWLEKPKRCTPNKDDRNYPGWTLNQEATHTSLVFSVPSLSSEPQEEVAPFSVPLNSSIQRDLADMESMLAKRTSTPGPMPLLASESDCDEVERARDTIDTLEAGPSENLNREPTHISLVFSKPSLISEPQEKPTSPSVPLNLSVQRGLVDRELMLPNPTSPLTASEYDSEYDSECDCDEVDQANRGRKFFVPRCRRYQLASARWTYTQ